MQGDDEDGRRSGLGAHDRRRCCGRRRDERHRRRENELPGADSGHSNDRRPQEDPDRDADHHLDRLPPAAPALGAERDHGGDRREEGLAVAGNLQRDFPRGAGGERRLRDAAGDGQV